MKRFLTISLVLLSLFAQGQGFARFGGFKKKATAAIFSGVSNSQSGGVLSVSFTAASNQNKPPSLESVVITGTTTKGQVLTATPQGFFSPGGYAAGTHLYQWYRSTGIQSTPVAISGATSSTYTLVDADVIYYILCKVTPVQVGGMNTQGTVVSSIYTAQIQDSGFNPFTNITWFIAHQPSGASDLAASGWVNMGTGNASTQNGSDPIPTYVAGQGVDFESSNNEELVLDQPSTAFTAPVTIIVRVKFESFNASWGYILACNSAQIVEQRASGALYLSGGTCAYTPTVSKWVILYYVVSGATGTSKFKANNGSWKTDVSASTGAFGTANGRIGSNAGGTSNRFDGLISHVFMKQGELTGTEFTNMETWFSTNAPYDP